MSDKNKTYIKNDQKGVFGQKRRLYIDTESTQQDSEIMKTHPATLYPPYKSQFQSIDNYMQ